MKVVEMSTKGKEQGARGKEEGEREMVRSFKFQHFRS